MASSLYRSTSLRSSHYPHARYALILAESDDRWSSRARRISHKSHLLPAPFSRRTISKFVARLDLGPSQGYLGGPWQRECGGASPPLNLKGGPAKGALIRCDPFSWDDPLRSDVLPNLLSWRSTLDAAAEQHSKIPHLTSLCFSLGDLVGPRGLANQKLGREIAELRHRPQAP